MSALIPDAFPLAYHEDRYSNLDYVERHLRDLRAYVRDTYPRVSEDPHLRDILRQPPQVARSVIENYLLSESEKWRKAVRAFAKSESLVCLTKGVRGGRKTITTWDLARSVSRGTRRPLYGVGDPDDMPHFANAIPSIDRAPKWAVVVVDELAVETAARNSNTRQQKALPGLVNTARHNKNHFFGIIQNTAAGDLTWVQAADVLLLKPESLFESSMERAAVRRMVGIWSELFARDVSETLMLSKVMHPLRFKRPIPVDWKREYSESFRKITSWGEAIERATSLRTAGLSYTMVAQRMGQRGWSYSEDSWNDWVPAHAGGVDPLTGKKRKPRKTSKGSAGMEVEEAAA